MKEKLRFPIAVTVVALFMLTTGTELIAQNWPLLTIRELQEVTNPDSSEASPYLGDTVMVAGIAATGPREIWIGARWSFFLVTSGGGPWSGTQIVQHDSMVSETNVGIVEPGDSVIVPGVVAEYFNGTQLEVIDGTAVWRLEGPVPIQLIDSGDPPFYPVEVDIADLQELSTGEQWEEVLVTIDSVTVLNDDVGSGEGLIGKGENQISLEDWSNALYPCLGSGECSWPATGTIMNVTGYIRQKTPQTPGAPYMIAPWSLEPPYIVELTHPPVIGWSDRSPVAATSSDDVTVRAEIVDNDTVTAASVFYSVDGATYLEVSMSEVSPDTFAADIPAQADGALVKYYISSTDDHDYTSITPGDTLNNPFFYKVADGGLTVQDIQFTPFGSGNSGYKGLEVTIEGVVTSTVDQFAYYWIQNGEGPWSGLMVQDFDNDPAQGDLVQVTGTIQESYGFTRMEDVTAYSVISSGNALPEPYYINTGAVTTNSDSGEAYEGVLLEFRDLVVSDSLPDAPSNFGEFGVDDGTGEIRVDDLSTMFNGNSLMEFWEGDSIDVMRGYLYWSFSNYKLVPRDSTNDIIGHTRTSVTPEGEIPTAFRVSQNYPNPFNPETNFSYSIPAAGDVSVTIYNLLGQKVATLVDGEQLAGSYRVTWDGRDSRGRVMPSGIYLYRVDVDKGTFTGTRKMVLLK